MIHCPIPVNITSNPMHPMLNSSVIPEEDEQSDSGTDVLDTFRPVVLRQSVFEDTFRQRLSGCQCLFHQSVLCFPVFIPEVEGDEYDKEGESEYQYDNYQSCQYASVNGPLSMLNGNSLPKSKLLLW